MWKARINGDKNGIYLPIFLHHQLGFVLLKTEHARADEALFHRPSSVMASVCRNQRPT